MAYTNVIADPGAGGAEFAADIIGGVAFPRSKVTFGDEGSATDVSAAAPLPVTSSTADVTATGALGAIDAAVTVALAGRQGVGFFLAAGTLEATLEPQVSYDGGTFWRSTQFLLTPSGSQSGPADALTVSAGPVFTFSIVVFGGATHARVIVGTYTSGTADATLTATTVPGPATAIVMPGQRAGDADIGAGMPTMLVGGINDDAPEIRPLQLDADNRLRVNIDGSTTLPVIQNIDGESFVPTNTGGVSIMGAFDDASPDTLAEDTLGIIRATEYRALHVQLRGSAAGEVELGTTTAPLRVTGPVDGGDAYTVNDPILPMGAFDDGSNTIEPLRVTANRALHTNLRNASGDEIGTVGELPLAVTLRVEAGTEIGTAGAPLVVAPVAPSTPITERVVNTDGASTAFANFGAVGGVRNHITAISVFRTDAGTGLAYIDFRDGTAGAVLWSMPLPPNSGAVLAKDAAIFRGSVNTALAFDVSAALTSVIISISGYQAA